MIAVDEKTNKDTTETEILAILPLKIWVKKSLKPAPQGLQSPPADPGQEEPAC